VQKSRAGAAFFENCLPRRRRPLDTARHLAAQREIMQNNLTLKQKFIARGMDASRIDGWMDGWMEGRS